MFLPAIQVVVAEQKYKCCGSEENCHIEKGVEIKNEESSDLSRHGGRRKGKTSERCSQTDERNDGSSPVIAPDCNREHQKNCGCRNDHQRRQCDEVSLAHLFIS